MYVRPGGMVHGTGASSEEADAMFAAITKTIASPSDLYATTRVSAATTSSLPTAHCDALMLRMVYHMLKKPIEYLADFRQALKPGGKMLLLEHDSDNGATGREGAKLTVKMPSGMKMASSLSVLKIESYSVWRAVSLTIAETPRILSLRSDFEIESR